VNNIADQLRREVISRVQVHLKSYLAKPHLIQQIHINTIRQQLLDPSNFEQMATKPITGCKFWNHCFC
jgi:hypothetical protein